jgi:hypothetical protein
MQRVEGYVEQLRCGSCGGEFATFVFTGDSDMMTAGLETATAPQTGDVAIGGRLPTEMRDYVAGRAQFAERISDVLGVKFKPVPLLRAQHTSAPVTGDFSAFRRSYKPPELVYGCPRCGGEARVTKRQTPTEFIAGGGSISTVGVSLA